MSSKIIFILFGMAVLFAVPNNLPEAEPEMVTEQRLYCLFMENDLLWKYLFHLPRSTDIFSLSGSEMLNVCGKIIIDPDTIAAIEMIEQIRESNGWNE